MAKTKNNTESAAPETLEQALEIIAQQTEVIAELNKHIASLEAKPTQVKPSVAIGKHVYTINSGAYVDGTKYSAAELAENKEVCGKILEIEGQTILTKEEE
jgi:hypothetical protein